MGSLTIAGLTKSFVGRGSRTYAINDLDLDVAEGELIVLLGPSGCGKTTTLRSLAGLEVPDDGRITFGGKVVFDAGRKIDVKPNKRDIGMVFQSYALWPHLTVGKNIAYPLKARRRGDGIRNGWVEQAAELVNCSELLGRYPSQLSGGQQQRVALARALVARPTVMLFDEPLSNLDAKLREQLRADLHRLHRDLGFTGVYVTHDHAEALALGDRLAIMRHGRIEQLDTPSHVFTRPGSEYVAGFIGVDDSIALRRQGGQVTVEGGLLGGPVPEVAGNLVKLWIRSEDVRLHETPAAARADEITISGATVVDASFQGRTWLVALEVGKTRLAAVVDASSKVPEPGDEVVLGLPADKVLLYGEDGVLITGPSSTRQRVTRASAAAAQVVAT